MKLSITALASLILAVSTVDIAWAGTSGSGANGIIYFTGKATGAADTLLYQYDLGTGQVASLSGNHVADIKTMTLGSDGNLYAAVSYSTSALEWVDTGSLDDDGNPIYGWQTIITHHNKLNVYDMDAVAGGSLVSSMDLTNAPIDGSVARSLVFDSSGALHLQYGGLAPKEAANLYSVSTNAPTSTATLTLQNAPQIFSGPMALGHDSKIYLPGEGNATYNAIRTFDPAAPGATGSLGYWLYAENITGMAFSPRGNLYVMTGYSDGTSGLLTRWNGPSLLAYSTSVDYAAGLAMDANRNLIYSVADGNGAKFLRAVTPKGVLVANLNGQFDSISNLTAAALPAAAPLGEASASILVASGTPLPGIPGVTIPSAAIPGVSGPTGSGPVVFGFGGLDGICRVQRDGSGLQTLAYTGQTIPGTAVAYKFMHYPSGNSSGEATFYTSASSGGDRIIRAKLEGPPQVVFTSQTTTTTPPGGSGSWRIGGIGISPMINDAGQISVPAHLEKFVNSAYNTAGDAIYRINADNTRTIMAYSRWASAAGEPQTPGGSPIIDGAAGDYLSVTGGSLTANLLNPIKINSQGHVAFGGKVMVGGTAYAAVVRADGDASSSVRVLLRVGQSAPGGGDFASLKQLAGGNVSLAFNEINQVALPATLSDGKSGIYRAEAGGITEIVRSGMPAPDYNSPGGFNGFFANNFDNGYSSPVAINDNGVVLFAGQSLTETTGGAADNYGLFVGNGVQIAQVVREGQSLGNGDIFHFGGSSPAGSINKLGHVAFIGNIEDDEGGTTAAIFLSTGMMVKTLARAGQMIDGQTIVNFNISNFPSFNGAPAICLSDDDRVTFMAGSHLSITDLAAAAGATQDNAVLPGLVTGSGSQTTFHFTNAQSGAWVDPPFVDQFSYRMTGDSLFTQILDFPTGFAGLEVWANGNLLGLYGPGQNVVFPGSGVSSFEIRGINPLVDSADSSAFPLQLAFNTPTADFTMQVPEPTSLTTIFAVGMLMLRRKRR